MSEHHIEVLRRWTEEFNARDVEAQIAHRDPEIEFHSALRPSVGPSITGTMGCAAGRGTWKMPGKRIRLEADAFFDLGQLVSD